MILDAGHQKLLQDMIVNRDQMSRCMELYNTGATCATLPNDRCNTDRDIVLSSSDDDDE